MSYKVAGILLAGGLSRRSGSTNKLLASIDGTVMIRASLQAMTDSHCAPIYVVTGHQASLLRATLADEPVSFVHNDVYSEGMSSSIRAGINAVASDTDAVVIGLGDMPHLLPATITQLIEAYSPETGADICIPEYEGKPGNPVLFGRRFFGQLGKLTGDTGGKPIVRSNAAFCLRVPVNDPGIHIDHDQIDGL